MSLFESVVDSSQELLTELVDSARQSMNEAAGDDDMASKEYVGAKADTHYYLIQDVTDEGEVTDLVIVDQEDNKVMSAKEVDEETDLSDVRGFIISAIEEIDMDLVSTSALKAYNLLAVDKPEEEEGEEPKGDDEGKPEDKPEDTEPEVEDIPDEELDDEPMESVKRMKESLVEKGYKAAAVRVKEGETVRAGVRVTKEGVDASVIAYPLSEEKIKESEGTEGFDAISVAVKEAIDMFEAAQQTRDVKPDNKDGDELAKELMETGEYDVVARGLSDQAKAKEMAGKENGSVVADDKDKEKFMVIKAKEK